MNYNNNDFLPLFLTKSSCKNTYNPSSKIFPNTDLDSMKYMIPIVPWCIPTTDHSMCHVTSLVTAGNQSQTTGENMCYFMPSGK